MLCVCAVLTSLLPLAVSVCVGAGELTAHLCMEIEGQHIGTKKYLKSTQERFGGMSYTAGTAAELSYKTLYDHNYICKGVGYVQSYAMFKEQTISIILMTN